MNDETRKYLRELVKTRPSFEVFSEMTQVLKNEQKEIDQLFIALDTYLLKTFKTI